MSPRSPPKISLRHDWTKELVRKLIDNQREKLLDKQNSSNQPKIPNPTRDRSGQLGITQDVIDQGNLEKNTVAVQDDPEVYHEDETLNMKDERIRERIEADMYFKIPGLPHSVVKHAQSASVRALIQKIENHPNRHALQRDLRQSQSVNPFSPESKQMIHEVGNIELCEARDGIQNAVQSMFTILGHWHCLQHVRTFLA